MLMLMLTLSTLCVYNMKETCDRHNQTTLPSTWNCYDVNLTFSLPLGGSMDALVVQQAALGYVETILQQYNVENLDEAFVEYRYPKFVEAAMTVYAVGLTQAVMSNAERQLFLKVFRQGFDAVLASKASAVPMAVYDAEILYQVPPLAAADDSASSAQSDESIRARLDANSTNTSSTTTITPEETSNSDAVPLTSNVAVRMLVRATCAGSECHDGALAAALWEKGPPHADAWAAGVREQAAKSSNMALRNYFGPLETIVFESPSSSYHSNASGIPDNGGVYHPLSEVDDTQGVPTWIWIVVGVDAGILLLALLVACCRVAKRRKEWTGSRDANNQNKPKSRDDPEEPIPEQYPHEPYPNMAGLKEAAGSSHRGASPNVDDEFHDEGSERVFDDGIRVRKGQVEPGDANDEFHDDGSDRIFDDGIRVREVQVDPEDLLAGHGAPRSPPPQGPPPPPPPSSPTPPHEDLPYDDGVRVSVENAGQTSRVHDDGIHISNSIQDID
jgi:DNA replication initiation complex subunit (GINS family)